MLTDRIAMSALISLAEIQAALAAAARGGRVVDLDVALTEFSRVWQTVAPVPLDEPLVAHAGALARSHALRGYDAVQLACAIAAAGGQPPRLQFLTFDADLKAAAAREGFPTPL